MICVVALCGVVICGVVVLWAMYYMLILLYIARNHSTHMNMPTVCPPHLSSDDKVYRKNGNDREM